LGMMLIGHRWQVLFFGEDKGKGNHCRVYS
jgi:hypothetical protein